MDSPETDGARDAASSARAALDAALGDRADVMRSLRGRPKSATPRAPGAQAPTRTFRLSDELDERLTAFVAAERRPRSAVMRDALSEYLRRHSA